MKNTERRMLEPMMALVSMYAMANATTLITIVVMMVSAVEKQRVQELLIDKSPLVVFQTDEFGVGDGGELAEAQIHTHDERDHKPDDERGERWQREERPPLSYRLASHADHSLPAFFPSPFRVPRQRGREFHSPEEPSTALFPVSPVLTSVMINGMTANVKRCHFRMSRTAKYETLSPKNHL